MLLSKMLRWMFYPNRCAYCGKVIPAKEYDCEKCRKELPRIKGDVCDICGREKKECFCRKNKMYYKRVVAPFYFDGTVRKGIHCFKFRKSPQNAEAYVREMVNTVNDRYAGIKFDCVINVPMSERNEKERGYNQSDLLARGISEAIGAEYCKDIISKIYETDKQHDIPFIYRKGNLVGVYEIFEKDKINNKTVLLCDDVSTTGETFNECAKMLWLNGAEEIYCVAVALTKRRKK